MSQVDQFESVFRSAIKDIYEYRDVDLRRMLVVTDMPAAQTADYTATVQAFMSDLDPSRFQWHQLAGDQYQTTGELLEKCERIGADLIFAYRNLHSEGWQFPHSLGEHLDVLLQRARQPVMVLPHPKAGYADEHAMKNTSRVMAVTDHLSNDHQLVNHAQFFTRDGGHLYLTHIEDEAYFSRVMEAISKIPNLDTRQSETLLREQLLKAPRDYIKSCETGLKAAGKNLQVHEIVTFGHRLSDYKGFIDRYRVDLLAMHTRDEDQLAMHGMAYPLAIELRQIPLLML